MIPDYQTLMLPVLKSCAAGEVTTSAVVDGLAVSFKLGNNKWIQTAAFNKARYGKKLFIQGFIS